MPAAIPVTQKGTVPITWDGARERYKLTTRVNGVKRRQFFKTEADALRAWKSHVRTVERYGKQATEYDAFAHREYEEAKRIARNRDLRDVARFFIAHHPEDLKTLSFSAAAAQFEEQNLTRQISELHRRTLKSHLNGVAATFGDTPLQEISSNRLLVWLLGLSKNGSDPRTVKNYYGSLCNFFNWCARRKLVAVSPTKEISKHDLPVLPNKGKGILSVEQTAAMFARLEKDFPQIIPWHALQVFAGLRNAEAARFRREWIDFSQKTITLPGWVPTDEGTGSKKNKKFSRVVKTGDDWVLHDLPENLWPWLKKYLPENKPFVVPNERELNRLRKEIFPKLPKSPISQWPMNAMRHTFCTMLISLHSDAAKVANWSRHTNPRMLYRNYVTKLVPKATAEKFLKITPRT